MKIWKKGSSFMLLMRMQISTAIIENDMEVPQKIKNKTLYDPVILLSVTYTKEMK
jgi:hypothetical protein